MKSTTMLFLLPTFLLLLGRVAPASSEEPGPVPEWVLDNWRGLIGVWVADNSAYKSDEESMDAFGIEWTWGLGERSLRGRLYGIKNGEEVGTFWEFREFWHPGEGRLLATQFGADGTYGVGPHTMKEDGSTEMLQTFYDGATGRETRIGHRAVLEGDEHRTRSFNVDANGNWTDRRAYVWRREKK